MRAHFLTSCPFTQSKLSRSTVTLAYHTVNLAYSKSGLIVYPDNIEARKRFGLYHVFKVYTAPRYCHNFIRNVGSKRDYLKERIET